MNYPLPELMTLKLTRPVSEYSTTELNFMAMILNAIKSVQLSWYKK